MTGEQTSAHLASEGNSVPFYDLHQLLSPYSHSRPLILVILQGGTGFFSMLPFSDVSFTLKHEQHIIHNDILNFSHILLFSMAILPLWDLPF